MIGIYSTPHAFRAALEARLRNIANEQGTDLQRLRRQVAFERLLARLFSEENPPWLLKGGYALELRLPAQARSTVDLDFSMSSIAQTAAAYEKLQEMADQKLEDGFQFFLHQPKSEQTGAPGGGFRCSVESRLAGRTFTRFHLDIGMGDPVITFPDWIEGNRLLDFADIPPARIALYPLAEQFAEKVYAYTFPWKDRKNTRIKDLVDMVLLIDSELLIPDKLRPAIQITFASRQTHAIPSTLPSPPQTWAESYRVLAQELRLSAKTLSDAYILVDDFWQKNRLWRE